MERSHRRNAIRSLRRRERRSGIERGNRLDELRRRQQRRRTGIMVRHRHRSRVRNSAIGNIDIQYMQHDGRADRQRRCRLSIGSIVRRCVGFDRRNEVRDR